MKLSLWFIELMLFVGLCFCVESKAAVELKVLGLYDYSMLKFDNTTSQSAVTNRGDFGGGLLLEIKLSPKIGLEFGGLYQPYGYKLVDSGTTTVNAQYSWHFVNIPLILRWHLGSVVSLGAGGYYGISIDRAHGTGTVLGVANTDADLSSQAKSDYGVAGSLAFKIRLGSRVNFLLEGRFLYGLKNLSSISTVKQSFWHAQGLGGFGFIL